MRKSWFERLISLATVTKVVTEVLNSASQLFSVMLFFPSTREEKKKKDREENENDHIQLTPAEEDLVGQALEGHHSDQAEDRSSGKRDRPGKQPLNAPLGG